MNRIFLCFSLFLLFTTTHAQNINGIVNNYAMVTGVNNNVFNVFSSAGFSAGDKVMIIKMKGATINTSASPSYGDTVNTNQAGLYLFSRVVAVTPNTITVSPYCNDYFTTPEYLQIVRIPVFGNANIIGDITCPGYDGATGGVIAFEADTLTMNASVDGNIKGYRGGDVWGSTYACNANTWFSMQSAFGPEGKKGEGIADYIAGQECGRGKLANGGGGSFAGNTGAGGGANAGNGGHGGWESDSCFTQNKFSYGAQPVNHSPDKFFMGGGGGGPQGDNQQQIYNGGNGGSIIYIKAKQIIGNGYNIMANGETTPVTADEGGSGGGAGGGIYLEVNDYIGSLNVTARGGDGSSNFNVVSPLECQGPGGGGGGGFIHFSSATIPAGLSVDVSGGNAGMVMNPQSMCYNTTYHALPGGDGEIQYNFVSTPFLNPGGFTLGPDQPLCPGLTVTLDAGPFMLSYLWDDLSSNQTRVVNSPGNYFVTINTVNNCTASDTVRVYLDTSVNASFNVVKHLGCIKDTIELVNTSTGAGSYIWYFGDSQSSLAANPSHVYANQGVYNIMLVANGNPCKDTAYATVDVTHSLNANMNVYGNLIPIKFDTTCMNNNLQAQSLSVPPGLTTNVFYWGDGTFSDVGYNVFATHKYMQGGIYPVTLVITDSLGCQDSISKQVYVDGSAYGDFHVTDSVVCVGTPVVFYDTISPFTLSFEYDFADQSILADVRTPTHAFDIDNNYLVTLTMHNLVCPDTTVTHNIVVDNYPVIDLGKDTSICPGITGTIVLSNLDNPAGVYEWSTGETANSISITNAGYYWASGTSANAGCRSTDSIHISRDCYINIPNAFSPDGDGLNDYFIPRELISSGVKVFRMNIYNRWGENVFTTTTVDGRGWDGTYNNKPQPMGAYVYIMDVEFVNGVKKTFKGNTTLVR